MLADLNTEEAFVIWLEKYKEYFGEAVGVPLNMVELTYDFEVALHSFNRGFNPEVAANKDARFMMTGEY